MLSSTKATLNCYQLAIPLLQEAMRSPCCEKLYITEVLAEFPADVFFPPVDTTVFRPVAWVQLNIVSSSIYTVGFMARNLPCQIMNITTGCPCLQTESPGQNTWYTHTHTHTSDESLPSEVMEENGVKYKFTLHQRQTVWTHTQRSRREISKSQFHAQCGILEGTV